MNAKFGIGVALLLLAPMASAQVYKCKGASGETVYSEVPCGAGSAPMKLRSNRAASESAGEASNRAAVYRTTGMSDAGIAERNCLQGEQSRIYGPLESRAQATNRQVAELDRQLAAARSAPPEGRAALSNATLESGIRAQISSLQQSLSSERVAADSQMSMARDRCSALRREREDRVNQQYAAPAGPSY
ncbi:DUF4124 domain-containing protein [Stenotrophomonas sp. ESTM1D_MKCIP4_1]|uniref:DUF4124 domain-containing protein n=1 Tax=Stenotrophomonas sp. ESTM1D_MKCIP4_1 TaxID=2072414 RepID=UPI000D53FA7F|nr:DUF4124 domain-containing protein [Stenotrophomonas sp. ESTM1D_MKCIP4_1]AWH52992.1 DUF4124 domain-containing protein [Stenotrophomonas sp. ESTM1D_MKCIP4_1]